MPAHKPHPSAEVLRSARAAARGMLHGSGCPSNELDDAADDVVFRALDCWRGGDFVALVCTIAKRKAWRLVRQASRVSTDPNHAAEEHATVQRGRAAPRGTMADAGELLLGAIRTGAAIVEPMLFGAREDLVAWLRAWLRSMAATWLDDGAEVAADLDGEAFSEAIGRWLARHTRTGEAGEWLEAHGKAVPRRRGRPRSGGPALPWPVARREAAEALLRHALGWLELRPSVTGRQQNVRLGGEFLKRAFEAAHKADRRRLEAVDKVLKSSD